MYGILIIFLIIIGITIVSLYVSQNVLNRSISKNSSMMLQNNIRYKANINYIGGIKNLLLKENGKIELYDDFISIILPSINKIININDIIQINSKSETEISKDVTLTRLLLVGILAFGLKKTTETTKKYFVITYKELGNEYNMIFECSESEAIVVAYDGIKEMSKWGKVLN